jgi:hypothetical protein
LYQWGEKSKGLQRSLFLAINAKGGENIKPKAKRPHHHHFKKNQNKVLIGIFQTGIIRELVFHLVFIFHLIKISKLIYISKPS